jgi:hypothetical protein
LDGKWRELKKLNPLHKWMINRVESSVGDFRDWDTITSWAMAIAGMLKENTSASGTQLKS